jgi:hypothetical protein
MVYVTFTLSLIIAGKAKFPLRQAPVEVTDGGNEAYHGEEFITAVKNFEVQPLA